MASAHPWLMRDLPAWERVFTLLLASLLLAVAAVLPSTGWLSPACVSGPVLSAASAPAPVCHLEAPATGPRIASGSLPGIMPRPAVVEAAGAPVFRATSHDAELAPPDRSIRPLTPPPTAAL